VEMVFTGQSVDSGATDRWADTPSLAQASGEAALVHLGSTAFHPLLLVLHQHKPKAKKTILVSSIRWG